MWAWAITLYNWDSKIAVEVKIPIYYKYTEDIYMLSTATAVGIRLIVSMQRWLLGDGDLAPGLDSCKSREPWNGGIFQIKKLCNVFHYFV
jgi:hypothetical protein